MSSSAAEQSLLRLTRAPIIREPFRHIYIRDVFPAGFYAEMVKNLPSDATYGTERAYPHRRQIYAVTAGGFWGELCEWMGASAFIGPLYQKFRDVRFERFGDKADVEVTFDIRLVRDDPEYSLSAHTDQPGKFLSFLFYLPRDDGLRDFGTTILRHKTDPEFTSDGGWLGFADFAPVWTAPFMPNCCFAFARTDKSFHGVLPNAKGGVRDALLLNIFAQAKPGDNHGYENDQAA